ncbi:Ethyl tert-butyl ether degradation EthD [Beutenbergia cavernae DSM 12333]|uniref:Ethyl tert-butyl ether degradation EthD n=1 Tax=Beutenbergia cavernae (strain ATCC BAA-8 / DSM 12333 / CCUG 43141 / JCM 11478 / NBRC 16432 / NCIMB 13614 / HKI 0122) TaxID=471853 RepID=C5C275_BEUC1|nr:EthD family reductase [Beutenbergia cavernae]ACQ81700.1 Ethyl tert-butyl ether degradation EthD [Beutenbergia cavernae DSM 12333]
MFCASVVYPADAERFDAEYFATQHAPMFARLLGENCVRWEVHRALATPGAPTSPFLAAAYFWVTSGELFGATLAEHGEEIYADIPRFSATQPARGWAEVL